MNKKVYSIVLFISILAATTGAQAQVGRLKDKLQMKKEKSEKSSDDNSSAGDNSSAAGGGASKGKEAGSGSSGAVVVDYKENPLPPSVDLYSILDDGLHLDVTDPYPYIGIVKIAFLPTKDVDGKSLFDKYAKEQPNVLYGTIKDKSGKVVYKRILFPMTSQKPITPVNPDDYNDIEIAEKGKGFAAGDYSFEVNIADKVIFSMPFQIIVGKNDDPYASTKEIRMIDGYWSKYGCYRFDKQSENFTWTTWETDHNMVLKGSVQHDEPYKADIQIFYNGAPFSGVTKEQSNVFRGKWKDVNSTFHPIADKNGSAYLKSSDFKDGKYVIKETYNGKQREYPFEIKDSKPVYIAEQDKAKTTDPAKVFEGLNYIVFVKNVKG